MKKLLISVTAASAMLAAAPRAFATPITYEFSADASATFPTGACTIAPCTDNISGTFTFDPTTTLLSAPDIIVTGNVEAGTYDTIPGLPISTGADIKAATSALSPTSISIVFVSPLDSTGASLSSITFYTDLGALITQSNFGPSAVTGSADPIAPLPASLPLFATGLSGLGLLGWRRKRKNAIAATI